MASRTPARALAQPAALQFRRRPPKLFFSEREFAKPIRQMVAKTPQKIHLLLTSLRRLRAAPFQLLLGHTSPNVPAPGDRNVGRLLVLLCGELDGRLRPLVVASGA